MYIEIKMSNDISGHLPPHEPEMKKLQGVCISCKTGFNEVQIEVFRLYSIPCRLLKKFAVITIFRVSKYCISK